MNGRDARSTSFKNTLKVRSQCIERSSGTELECRPVWSAPTCRRCFIGKGIVRGWRDRSEGKSGNELPQSIPGKSIALEMPVPTPAAIIPSLNMTRSLGGGRRTGDQVKSPESFLGASGYCRRRSALSGAIPDDSRRPVAPGRALRPAEAVEWRQCRAAPVFFSNPAFPIDVGRAAFHY